MLSVDSYIKWNNRFFSFMDKNDEDLIEKDLIWIDPIYFENRNWQLEILFPSEEMVNECRQATRKEKEVVSGQRSDRKTTRASGRSLPLTIKKTKTEIYVSNNDETPAKNKNIIVLFSDNSHKLITLDENGKFRLEFNSGLDFKIIIDRNWKWVY